MQFKTVLLAVVLLGIFTYTLPLYAGNDQEYHLEERTVIDLPVIGKVSTLTSSYLAGCQLKEQTVSQVHNTLLKMLNGGTGRSEESKLIDICNEMEWRFDFDDDTVYTKSFQEILALQAEAASAVDSQNDMESDHFDIDSLPRFTREDQGMEKNINGFKARKIVTKFYPEDAKHPILFEEFYSTKARSLTKINATRTIIKDKLRNRENMLDGVPNFIQKLYAGVRGSEVFAKPRGEVVRFIIVMPDDDNDPVFSMTYDVLTAETDAYNAQHFSLK